MTKDEFEKGYAKRSGVTVKWLHDHNQFGIPCDCGEDGCAGWKFDLDNGFSSPIIKFCPFCGKVLRRCNAMRITEIISILERELQLHGDIEVWRRSDHGDDPLLSDFNLNSPDDLYEEATEYAPERLLL